MVHSDVQYYDITILIDVTGQLLFFHGKSGAEGCKL